MEVFSRRRIMERLLSLRLRPSFLLKDTLGNCSRSLSIGCKRAPCSVWGDIASISQRLRRNIRKCLAFVTQSGIHRPFLALFNRGVGGAHGAKFKGEIATTRN